MEKLLEDIGLTEGETKVYLALLRLGSTKIGPLISESGVSASKIYKILERLQKKGLTGHMKMGRTKHFKAMPPTSIISYMEEAEKRIEQKKKLVKRMLPQFEKISRNAKESSEAFVYSGFKAVKNFLFNMIEILNPGESYHVMGAIYEKEIIGIRRFYKDFHTRRYKKNIKVIMLANYDTKGNIEKETFINGEIRYLPQYLLTNMHIFIYRKNIFMILWAKNPIAFHIRNEDVVKSFTTYFNVFWKLAKK